MKLTKTEMINAYAEMYDITKRQSSEEIERMTLFIIDALLDGDELHFKNLGVFGVKQMGAKKLMLPGADTFMECKAFNKPYFKFSENMKARVKEEVGM